MSRYLIIDKDFKVSQIDVVTGWLRGRCRKGEISIIDTKLMKGMNRASWQEELGEWSDIQKEMQ